MQIPLRYEESEIVEDFFPSPEKLVFKEENVKS